MFLFFNDTATTEIYTLSLHDALPILVYGPHFEKYRYTEQSLSSLSRTRNLFSASISLQLMLQDDGITYSSSNCSVSDRKSTRLNSSHANISYAVFCLKKKNNNNAISK